MKFDEVYPDATPGVPPAPNVVPVLREEQVRPCSVCGEPTRWFHRAFILHVCSEECVQQLLECN